MTNLEYCPEWGSYKTEWRERSPNGESKCANCGHQGPGNSWVRSESPTPKRTRLEVERDQNALAFFKKHVSYLEPEQAQAMFDSDRSLTARAYKEGWDDCLKRALELAANENAMVNLVYEWKFFWMNQHQNSEEDFKNYFQRAFGVDANMVHDLARRISDRIRALATEEVES